MKILTPKDLNREIEKIVEKAAKLMLDNFNLINKLKKAKSMSTEEINETIKRQEKTEKEIIKLVKEKLAILKLLENIDKKINNGKNGN